MRVITRHMTAQIFMATALVLFALIGLFMFFDLVNQADKIGSRYGIVQAFLITTLAIPGRLYEVMPIAVLLGAVYTMSRWASNSEFTILRVAGMSPLSLARSLLFPGIILVALTYLLGEVVSPVSDRVGREVETSAKQRLLTSSDYRSGVWARDQIFDKDGKLQLARYVNVRSLSTGQAKEAKGWRVYEFSPNDELLRLLEAPYGRYDQAKGWILEDVNVTKFPALTRKSDLEIPENISYSKQSSLVLPTTLAPEILSVMVSNPSNMSMRELRPYLQHLKVNQEETGRYEIAFWRKAFYPLSIFVMLALSMPFAYMSARAGGVSLKIFLGVMIGVAFFALNNLFSYLGVTSSLSPLAAAIMPTLVVLLLAAVSVWRVEQR